MQAGATVVPGRARGRRPRGRPYFWIKEGAGRLGANDRSDYQAVRDGWISVTPLQPDLTCRETMRKLSSLEVMGDLRQPPVG